LSFREWRSGLYPLPLILLLAIALIGSWTYFGLSQRRPRESDQRRLDRLVDVVPRHVVRRLDEQDFAQDWGEDLTRPLQQYLEDLTDLEHRFEDQRLERLRDRLDQAVVVLLNAERENTWAASHKRGYRNVGIMPVEAEFDPERGELYEARSMALQIAAYEVQSAYNDLMGAALERGYNLSRLEDSRRAS
jgi:hypothetical protein